MSFSITVPRVDPNSEGDIEWDSVWDAVRGATISPKPDKRTKTGKLQERFAEAGKNAFVSAWDELPYRATEGKSVSGAISGHVNADGTGNVSLNVTLSNPPKTDA